MNASFFTRIEPAVHAHDDVAALFAPASVCVAGVSRDPAGVWDAVVRNLTRAGYTGKIFPVLEAGGEEPPAAVPHVSRQANVESGFRCDGWAAPPASPPRPHVAMVERTLPEAGTILGLPVYRKPSDIVADRPPDLAVLCLSGERTPGMLREFAALGARAALVLGPGCGETRGAGRVAAERLRRIARCCGMTMLGPDSGGICIPQTGLFASPAQVTVRPGGIGFFARSGALCASLLELAATRHIGFSSFVSLGDWATAGEADMLDHFAADPRTNVIASCLEYIEDGPRFLRSARSAADKKPVILLRIGRSAVGARTVSACTGAVTASAKAGAAAFRKAGIIEVGEFDELFGLAAAFDACTLPAGPATAVIADDWSLGAAAADCCEENGLVVPPLSTATVNELQNLLPFRSLPFNPVNAPADASPALLGRLAGAVLRDAAASALLLLVCVDARRNMETLPDILAGLPNFADKTVLVCLMGGKSAENARECFAGRGIPCLPSPGQAAACLAALYRRRFRQEQPQPVDIDYRHDRGRARAAVAEARAGGAAELSLYHAREIMRAYEIPCLDSKLARTGAEAVQIAAQIGGPVALKIASPHITHKADVQGTVLNLGSPKEIRAAFTAITSRAARLRKEAYIAGCIVQAMSPANARATSICMKRDRVFGPMLLFGLESGLPGDSHNLSCRLLPLSLDDAHDMVREVLAFPVRPGQATEKEMNFAALEDILLILSRLALDCPEMEEIACSPVTVDHQGAEVVNVKILLARTPPGDKGRNGV
ncbi:MAG: acetate--CoA ligase family protein [Desulfovibrio sp.]|jgi:acetyltransferase|nr:acetate--CoA ligase family protein [Desulfovibrio sp.]